MGQKSISAKYLTHIDYHFIFKSFLILFKELIYKAEGEKD